MKRLIVRNIRQNRKVVLGSLLLLIVISSLWELLSRTEIIDPVFFGQPSNIGRHFYDAIGSNLITVDARATVGAALIGFGIAAVSGILSAFILAQSDTLQKICDPFLTMLNSLPRVALAPLFLLWFGIGSASKVALAVSISYFVILYSTMAGVAAVDRDHIVLARTIGASRLQIFSRFIIPSAIPSIFAGLQLGLVYGMLGTVTSEMLAGERGLGVVLTRQAALFQTDQYFATLLVLALITTILSLMMEVLRRRLLRWQRVHLGSGGGA